MEEDIKTDAAASDLKLDNLPEILDFHEERTPQLIETRQRLEEAAIKKQTDKAEAIANTYKETAKAYLDQYARRRADFTPTHVSKIYGGMLINVARIWKRLGLKQQCVMAIDEALAFCHRRRWDSVATVLESEKNRILNANA